MAGVLNDYNQIEGDPTIRIGNWVEERALLEHTGYSRGSSVILNNNKGINNNNNNNNNNIDTKKRTIDHRDGAGLIGGNNTNNDYYLTTNNYYHKYNLIDDIRPSVPPLPRKSLILQSELNKKAEDYYKLLINQKKQQEEIKLNEERYGGKMILNRKRALERIGKETINNGGGIGGLSSTLHQPAITVYSDLLKKKQLDNNNSGGSFHGVSAIKSNTIPFGKSTSFSKPIDEYYEAPMR